MASPAAEAPLAPAYELALDERDPARVEFTLRLDPAAEQIVGAAADTESVLLAQPSCPAGPLTRLRPGRWLKPAGCGEIRWSARLIDHDAEGLDAAAPAAAWSARHRMWVLTGRLPWLRLDNQAPTSARIQARRAGGGSRSQLFTISPGRGAPLALVVGTAPARRYAAGGFPIDVRGEVPKRDWADDLQRRVARTMSEWRRDIAPDPRAAPRRLDIVWVKAPAGTEPGFFASTGSHAILMQYIPDPAAERPDDKLKAAILLIGAHEGFHALAPIPGRRPAWVEESMASFFAYQAARRHLRGDALALATELVPEPTPTTLLAAQQAWDKGDRGSATPVFYGKGARFWGAIEAVLEGPANRSGRLAALIKRTSGLRGLDWSSPAAIAAALDRHSAGRAGPIVRCYVEGEECPAVAGAPEPSRTAGIAPAGAHGTTDLSRR